MNRLIAACLLAWLTFPVFAEDSSTTRVAFVCEHGNVKSMMAAAYFNRAAQERHLPFSAVARGVSVESERAPPAIVAGMKAEGFDVETFRAVGWTPADVERLERVVTIGTSLPVQSPTPRADVERWEDVPPASKDYEAASRALHAHVDDLLRRLTAEQEHRKL
jgi:protein-tyrosine-phosphatase